MRSDQEDADTKLQALAEPRRRHLYEIVAAAAGAVSRDEAAAATGLMRGTAAFHLDQLAAAGLLRTEYRRLSGRSGPGAGRPAKLYRAVAPEVSVSVPPRRYLLAAHVFAEAIGGIDGGPAHSARVAHRLGRRIGARRSGPSGGLIGQLEALGYAPIRERDSVVRLTNCPFRAVVEHNVELMCTSNLAFLEGLTESVGGQFTPRLAPESGWCCVRLDPVPPTASTTP